MEELSALRELKLRLEEPDAREDPELPLWALRDERFRCLLREAHRQVSLGGLHPSDPPGHSDLTSALLTGQSEQAGAAAGGGGRAQAEEGVQGSAADEGPEPEGAAAGANVQVGSRLEASPQVLK